MEAGSNNSKEANEGLVSSIKQRLEAISSLKSIFRVPERLKTYNVNTYTPDQVSIGPLHHGKANLRDMEEHKWHYLYTLLSRRPNLDSTLFECVKALRELQQTARHCYEESLNLTSDKLVEMMLIDGCFIIELFFKYALKGLRRGGDPIFKKPGLFIIVRRDLILLENQIPWMILQSLFEIVPIPMQCTLSELAFRFFRKMLPGEQEYLTERFSQEGNHLLDLIRQCYLPTYPKVLSKEHEFPKDLECATKLQKYGIKFMKFTAKSLLDISFSDGVFEIPPLVTHQFTEVLFANLIALEHHEADHVQHFTSYALVMKAFIHCEKDVKLFRHLRIVVSDDERKGKHDGSGKKEKDSGELFSRLCEGVDGKGFYYEGIVEQVRKYKAKKPWRRTLNCTCLN